MYNRYIPQPDGSYRRNRMPSPPNEPRHDHQPACTVPQPPPCPPPAMHTPPCEPQRKPDTITGFFKNLLPKNMDTADLLIILLLLLMAGDCEEERNNALLTMALYFFM